MNTIGDMQNEMDFFYHCNKFEYNHDYLIMITMTWNDKINSSYLYPFIR